MHFCQYIPFILLLQHIQFHLTLSVEPTITEENGDSKSTNAQYLNRVHCTNLSTYSLQNDDEMQRAVAILKTCGFLILEPESLGPTLSNPYLIKNLSRSAKKTLMFGVQSLQEELRENRTAVLPEGESAGNIVFPLLLRSPVRSILRAHFGGVDPELAYYLVWEGGPGVGSQLVHTDSEFKGRDLSLFWLLDRPNHVHHH